MPNSSAPLGDLRAEAQSVLRGLIHTFPVSPLCTASPEPPFTSATPLGDLRAEAQSVLRRLCRLVQTNKERLVGMVAQFDEGDKGYLNKMELVREGRKAQWVEVVPTWLADNEGKRRGVQLRSLEG